MAIKYKCGAEFLPSPMASKAEFALTSEPSLVRKGHMTAVAVAVEMEHAVAFLGTATGEVRTFFVFDLKPAVYRCLHVFTGVFLFLWSPPGVEGSPVGSP